MVTWAEFAAAAPELAAEGRKLLYRSGHGEGFLATVRDDASPRIHPISVGIVGDGLYAFVLASSKRRDLDQDGRYALHTHQDAAVPNEFMIRGRADLIENEVVRSAVAAEWSFDADQTYALFEFSIESALLGTRSSQDDWPPHYSSWAAERDEPATTPR